MPNQKVNRGVHGTPSGDKFSEVLDKFESNFDELYDRPSEGPTGPAGPKGDPGVAGPAGPAGSAGAQGPKGDTGDTGAQGAPGVKGDTGDVGPQGIPGVKGDTGDTGPQGSAGPQGVKGDTGDTGPAGSAGPQGNVGNTGPQGVKGDTGDTGPAGGAGPEGPQGIPGTPGSTGSTGPKGDTGDTGPTGGAGPQGDIGPQGPAGTPGSGSVTRITADITNSTVTMANVTGLSFAVAAGSRYHFRFVIPYTAAATTTGARWSISGPASPTFLAYRTEYTLTATTRGLNDGLTAYDQPAAAGVSSLAAGNIAIIEGVIQPSANGTVIARFASEVAASAIVAKAGSLVIVS